MIRLWAGAIILGFLVGFVLPTFPFARLAYSGFEQATTVTSPHHESGNFEPLVQLDSSQVTLR